MAYISSDGTSLFYRQATSSAPLAGIAQSGTTTTGGTFTMSVDYACNAYAAGAGGSIYGFKFPVCYTNRAGTWGACAGSLFQDAGTWEALGHGEDKQAQYPGFNASAVTFGVAGATGTTAANGIANGAQSGMWIRQISVFNNRGLLSRIQGFIAVRNQGNWRFSRENQNNANAATGVLTHLSVGGRYRVDSTSTYTLSASLAAATSATLNGGATWANMTDTRWQATFSTATGTPTKNVSFTNGLGTLSWTGAVTDVNANPTLLVREHFPDAFVQAGTMIANVAIYDGRLNDADICSLLNWENPMRLSKWPYEFYPMREDEGLSPRDVINGWKLTHYTSPYDIAASSGSALGTGMKWFPSSGVTMSNRATRDPPEFTMPKWRRNNYALLNASGIAALSGRGPLIGGQRNFLVRTG